MRQIAADSFQVTEPGTTVVYAVRVVVSRIKETHDLGLDTRSAIAEGIRATAGVVTGAAVIMVAVFAVFGTLSLQQFKQLSVGPAVAVFLDATLVRVVLLPSIMTLLGERNWYLPRWMSRLARRQAGSSDSDTPPPSPRTSPNAPAPPTGMPGSSRTAH